MNKHPLSVIQDNDETLFNTLMSASKMALGEGAIPAKYKYLIALALDASHGAAAGVTSLARQALALGATKEEIMEAVRVAYHVCGAGSAYTAAAGLNGVFGEAKPL
jgi:alkylhydroperoxidase/carboxymuconolactone decarboxylase family protein YurZ